MKRAVILLLLAVFLLTGCAKKKEIVVDTLAHTISDGSYTYQYSDTTDGDTRTIVIKYPDGGSYQWKIHGSDFSVGSMQSGPNGYLYTDGDVLIEAILNPGAEPEERSILWPIVVIGVLMAAAGLFLTVRPETVWNVFLKNVYEEEASTYAMTRFIARGIGLIVSGAGLVLLGLRVFF